MTDKRPVYLNLLKIRLPVTGMVSFAHRVSGVLLFLFIPYAVYLFDLSLASDESFQAVQARLDTPLMLLVQLLVMWALLHHFFAGIRFLLIDAEIGIEKHAARTGAWLVWLAEGLAMLTIIGVLLL